MNQLTALRCFKKIWVKTSLYKEGRRVSAGVVIQVAKPQHNAAKPPLFHTVRCAIIYKVASRLDKPPRSLRELPLL